MAPMFLISNEKMALAAIKSGIAPCIPALNYRTLEELQGVLSRLRETGKTYGINLIVNESNFKMKDQLDLCLEYKVPFIITSLGSPKEVIEKSHARGMKVFCDVSDMHYAHKAASYKPDGLIAVTSKAGGHTGFIEPQKFITDLVREFPTIPIISAGGVAQKNQIDEMLSYGACGVSVGSIFIASHEAPVTQEYKQACVDYGAKDIVLTTKLSGVPCTVINTPFVQSIGTKQTWLEKLANKNKRLKKWLKMIIYKRGMNLLTKSAFQANYQNVWCAGPSIEEVKSIRSIQEIVKDLVA